jgi:hypothetical protein
MPAGGRQRRLCMVLVYQHKHKHNGIGHAIGTGVTLVPAIPNYAWMYSIRRTTGGIGLVCNTAIGVDRCRSYALSLLQVEQVVWRVVLYGYEHIARLYKEAGGRKGSFVDTVCALSPQAVLLTVRTRLGTA